MTEILDDDWTQVADLPKGAVLALVGADNVYWLAVTTSNVKPEENRWEVHWLRRLTGRAWKSATSQFFCVDNQWSPTSIWRDSVIADLTTWARFDENEAWQINESVLDQVQTLVDKATSQNALCNLSTSSTSTHSHSDAEFRISEDLVVMIQEKCSSAIECVSDTCMFVMLFVLCCNVSVLWI